MRIDAKAENVSFDRRMPGKRNRIGALDPLVGYHLRRAFGAFVSDFNDAMEGTGMRQVLVAILAVVSVNPDINQGSVGNILGIKRANMVSLINELVDAGLITREVDASDRRAVALAVTEAGASMLDECLRRIDVHERRMLVGLSDSERTTLMDLLARIERHEVPVSQAER